MRTQSRLVKWSVLLIAGVAACGDDVIIPPPPPPPTPGVNSVSVAPNPATVNVGNTVQMVASVNADAGVATTVAWSTSDQTKASVSATGLATGVAAGSVAITACSNVAGFTGVCGSSSLTVTSAPTSTVTQVLVTPGNANITRPQSGTATLQMSAAVVGTNAPSQVVTWSLPAAPAGVTVGAATGLITITAATPAGTFNVNACSTVAGFTTVCGSGAITVAVPTPATVSLQSLTWVPQTPGTCAPVAGAVPQTVTLTNVNCQVEVTANVNGGDQQLARLDILFGGRVVQSQTFPGTAPTPDGEAAVSAPVDITLSVNTRQLRDQATEKVPVIFNGNQTVSANLYVVGVAVPLASNAVPVVMNNIDAFFVTPGVDGPSLQRTAVVAPAPVIAGGATWFKGTQTASGNFLAYSNTQPTAFNYSASTVCGGTTPAAATIAGTPTTGLVVTGIFTCAAVEGQNFLGAAPAGVLSYAPAVTGPDGTVLATAGGPPATALTYTNVGSAYQVPTGSLAAPAPENRYNPIALAVNPSGFIDNKGPNVDVAGSSTWNVNVPAAAGRIIAFNSLFDQWWINASYTFGACTTAACSGAANALSRIWATDPAGVGVAAGFPIAKLVVQSTSTGTASDNCTGATVASGADLPVTVTSLADAHRLCAYAEDLLANASVTVSATATAAVRALAVSWSNNISNRAGVDKEVPVTRFAGSTTAAPLLPLASTVSSTANTTIYRMAPPGPVRPVGHVFGLEAQDTRSGFHQGAALAGLPATLTQVRTTSPSPLPAGVTQPCAPISGALATLLSDTWVRSVTTAIDCGLLGAAGVGYWSWFGLVTDRAGNVSATIARNYAADDIAPPAITGLGFASAVYTPGGAGPFGFSANDDVEIIEASVGIGILSPDPDAGGPIFAPFALRYPAGSMTPLGARFDADCTALQPNCVFTSVLNGAVASIPYFIFRVDQTCSAVAVPYAGCPAASATPYVIAQKTAVSANYGTGPAKLPLAAQAFVVDVGSQIPALPIAAAMIPSQFSPSTGLSEPWTAADLISWSGSSITPSPGPPAIAGGVTAVHVASTSILAPFFDTASLWRRAIALSGGQELVYCGDFPAPTLTDNGVHRFWTYNTAYPVSGPCVSTPGYNFVGAAPVGQFTAGGLKGGAMLLTPTFP